MNAPQINNLDADTEFKMQAALAAQRHSYLAEGDVSAEPVSTESIELLMFW